MTYSIQKPIKMDFSIKVEATDFPKRELSGRIVTWNEEGVTSSGSTMFQKGSITLSDSTKLLLEHRRESPIGFLKSYNEDEKGIYATFSIGNTTAGSDALVEASTGLRDGFSVGVIAQKYKNVDGVLVVSASALKEVSLVTDPAIASAKVEIAASENNNSESELEADEQPTEGDKQVETPTAVQKSQPIRLRLPKSKRSRLLVRSTSHHHVHQLQQVAHTLNTQSKLDLATRTHANTSRQLTTHSQRIQRFRRFHTCATLQLTQMLIVQSLKLVAAHVR